MHFFTHETGIKRDAKRLKKSLARHGHEFKHTVCLDLMARLHGFANFSEWRNTIWDGALSPFDEDADDDTVEARFQHQ
ncbi:MAG: glyoxalase superfamily protein, partial [Bradyrhizobium sp.]